MKIGYFLSSEEWGPGDLVTLAGTAERAGFEGLWISDHYHPWNDEQGHRPFVWAVIGAIANSTSAMKLTTAVTCPTVRLHPGIIAQAAATSAILLEGRFCLGLGSGEALNEHIFGDRWPGADERLEMLEEAVEVIRALWQGGVTDHIGRHYRLEHCRVYDLPDAPPPIVISGFGPKAVDLAAKIGDGYCTVGPDADSVARFRSQAGADKLVQGGLKVCWDDDEAAARKTVHRLRASRASPRRGSRRRGSSVDGARSRGCHSTSRCCAARQSRSCAIVSASAASFARSRSRPATASTIAGDSR